MSSTQSSTSYTVSAGPGDTTPGGTSFNANIQIAIVPGSDFDDAAAWALHDALVTAFPAAWGVQSTDVSIYKGANEQTEYASNYAAKTFS